MGSILARFVVPAAIAFTLVASNSIMALAADNASPVQLATNFNIQTQRYQHLVCIYAQGSQVHQCAVTGTGPQYRVGMSCYCGNSPKGIIRAVPLVFAPQ